jgi:hypothetical protein
MTADSAYADLRRARLAGVMVTQVVEAPRCLCPSYMSLLQPLQLGCPEQLVEFLE